MAGGPGYASKPGPALIIQDDGFSETHSITVCPEPCIQLMGGDTSAVENQVSLSNTTRQLLR
jgi:hypothetical protein